MECDPALIESAGLRKETFKAWVRRLGTLCAVLQLGTAFAATRALFSSEARQRLVEMDLRWAGLLNTGLLSGSCQCLGSLDVPDHLWLGGLHACIAVLSALRLPY